MVFLYHCGLVFVAAIVLATGGAHLARLRGFALLLREHRILPGALAVPVAVVVTATELMVGAAGVVSLLQKNLQENSVFALGTFTAALGLGCAFTVYLRRLLRSERAGSLSCGCSPLASPVTPASFAPAGSLIAVGAIGLLVHWSAAASPLAPPAWAGLAALWGVVLAGLVLLLPASAPHPHEASPRRHGSFAEAPS